MAGSGRIRKGSGSKSKPSAGWTSAVFALAVAALAVSRWVRPHADDSLDVDAETDTDERVDYIRNALLKEGEAKFSGHHLTKIFNEYRDSDGLKQALASYHEGIKRTSRFSEEKYWDERYSKSESEFDWFGTWNDPGTEISLKPFVESALPSQVSEVLNLGCGNSRLAEELLNDGFSSVTSIDISQVAIDKMSQRFRHLPGLTFIKMDLMAMTFVNSSFDFIVDKGTLDALYTGSRELVKNAMPEIYRVLRPNGLFASMSFGSPENRRLLNATNGNEDAPLGWASFSYQHMQRQDGQGYHLYLMRKPGEH
jgi:SAM-dependent methyltransferase